jgi:hypothetical protein
VPEEYTVYPTVALLEVVKVSVYSPALPATTLLRLVEEVSVV